MPSGTRAQPVRRSQRLRNKRLLGPGRGIDNPSAVASVLLTRAGEHAELIDNVASLRQILVTQLVQNRSLADQELASYNIYSLQGNTPHASLSKKHWKRFVKRQAEAARKLKQLDRLSPELSLALNSVMVEVTRQSVAFR